MCSLNESIENDNNKNYEYTKTKNHKLSRGITVRSKKYIVAVY